MGGLVRQANLAMELQEMVWINPVEELRKGQEASESGVMDPNTQ